MLRRSRKPLRRSSRVRPSPLPSQSDGDAGHFLIEPGLGFPGRGGDGEASGQSNGAPKNSYDREDTSGRTDFIAAARRAARAAQLESAAATSNIAPSSIENGGVRVPGAVPVRGGCAPL